MDSSVVWMWIYILTCILAGIFGARYFMTKKEYVGMALFLIGALVVFVVYGTRWFGSSGIYSDQTVTWPPALNTCPDFLTAHTIKTTAQTPVTVYGCIDAIGVSNNGAFRKFTGTLGTVLQAPYSVNNQGNVTATLSDFFPIQVDGESAQGLCDRLSQYGLTWDGVYDGVTCAAVAAVPS